MKIVVVPVGLLMKLPRTETLRNVIACCRAVSVDTGSDAELLARITRQDDQEAFGALLQRHGPMVLAVCRRLLRDSHEASDAFQATFLVLLRKCMDLRQPDHLGPWLHGVAYRTASRLRQRAARRASAAEDLDAVPGPSVEPLDELARKEVRTIIDEEVQGLPGKYRLPVVLCYLQGQSYAEAAKSLGWPVGTVSVRLARARERLRKRLVRRGVSASLLGGLLAGQAKGMSVPVGLLATTLTAGSALAGGVPAGISPTVLTLIEGVLRAMWMQKLKSTVLAGVLVFGLAFTTLGSLTWHGAGQVAAQTRIGPLEKRGAAGNRSKDDDRSLQEQERQLLLQLKDIREQRARLNLRRASAILDEIEASLKKLRQATADSATGRRAVDAFAQAFARLKEDLRDSQRPPDANPGGGAPGRIGWQTLGFPSGIIQDGRVLQVDTETKTALLSVGRKDGVKKGDVYRAYQAGKNSPDQTAWLRVTEVSAKWSIATITQNFAPRASLKPQDILQRDEKKNKPSERHPDSEDQAGKRP
jgi:RNA polymerase sigma factor (sigma-70 family)